MEKVRRRKKNVKERGRWRKRDFGEGENVEGVERTEKRERKLKGKE